ncbi:hypothetical protein ACIRST_21160 [Kitasatospora sp. NPDC101447]|uniref:hypothetical protein n=1 Tax=Kitasatospora sp. NPDC101447 TaxID=3364102 RepID=UPI003817678D
MRSYTTKLTVAALAAATALSLAACGPDNADPAAPSGGSTGAAPAPTSGAPGATGGAATGGAATGGATGGSTAAPTGGAAGAATGGAATGGAATGGAATGGADATGGGAGGGQGLPQAPTAVKFGQPATVDFADKDFKAAAKLEINVTGIVPGSIKDFQDAKASTVGLEGRSIFYVSWTMKNLGDSKLTFAAPNSKFRLYATDGKPANFANSAGTPIAKCSTPSFSGATKGVEFKGCDIFSFPAGATPALVGYGDATDINKIQASWAK